MHVESLYDAATSTFTHVVFARAGGTAVIIDPVLDFDFSSARTSTASADRLLEFVRKNGLRVEWILETHAHADHLTAAAHLKEATGAKYGIGRGITRVQERFKDLFNLGPDFIPDGSQFDRLLDDGDVLTIGELTLRVLATPGHTQDSLAFLVEDAVFVGDTLFAPDTGTARADFPGGSAHELYRSIAKLFELPGETRVFLCHDYPPSARKACPATSMDEQREGNVHVGGRIDEDTFVRRRKARDATLAVPKLILPALQVNIRAGVLPPAERNGIRYLHLPLNQLGSDDT